MPEKMKREVSHIIASEEARGKSPKEAKNIAYGHMMMNPLYRQYRANEKHLTKKKKT